MSVFYTISDSQVVVSGRTYQHKEAIKALGGRFQGGSKTWAIPLSDSAQQQVHELCVATGGGPLQEQVVPPAQSPLPLAPVAPVALIDPQVQTEPSQEAALSLSQLMAQAQQALSACFPDSVWVMGEIQNLNRRRGAVFMQLAEHKQASPQASVATITVNVNIWQEALRAMEKKHGKAALDQVLQEGLSGRFLCRVSLYRDRGFISLSILDMDPAFTAGAIALARQKLLADLRRRGLADANRKCRLSPLPLKLGLVTAAGSRAEQDFLHQLMSYGYPGKVVFYPCAMQGEGVEKNVPKAIKALTDSGCDLIVLTRGGGSAADLRWFDAECVALAIAECPVPVVAAIGHHEDTCVAEEVCYLRQKTPTAAADFIIEVFQRTRERLHQVGHELLTVLRTRHQSTSQACVLGKERLLRQSEKRLNLAEQHLQQVRSRLQQFSGATLQQGRMQIQQLANALHNGPQLRFKGAHGQLQQMTLQLAMEAKQALAHHQQTLVHQRALLKAEDPKPWLSKGWSQLYREDGGLLRQAAHAQPGELLKARFTDGHLIMTVNQHQLHHQENGGVVDAEPAE